MNDHAFPQRVLIAPPAQALFESIPVEYAQVNEYPTRDEDGAPTLAGLVWCADEINRQAESFCEQHRKDGLHSPIHFGLARTLCALARLVVKYGCEHKHLGTVAPTNFAMRLFKSMLDAAEAMLAADGPLTNRTVADHSLLAITNTARELFDAVATGSALLNDTPAWANDEHFAADSGGYQYPAPTAWPNTATKSAVEAQIAATLDEAFQRVLPVTMAGHVVGIDTYDDRGGIQPRVLMRIKVVIR